MIPTIAIGTAASDFTLKDHNGQEFHLYGITGQKILLSFHPLAWTRVCAEQMKSLELNYDSFLKLDTLPVGISIDSVPSKKAWAQTLDITRVRLLSDFWPHGTVAALFNIFREKDGFSERANIILDADHRILFGKTYPISQLPDIDEILTALKS